MMDINWDKKVTAIQVLKWSFGGPPKNGPKLTTMEYWIRMIYGEKRKEIYFSFFLFLTSTEGELRNHSSPEYQTIHKNTSFANFGIFHQFLSY